VIQPNPSIKPRQRVTEPPQLAERRLVFSDPRVANPYVVRTYLAPERDPGAQEKAAALTMLAQVLGGSPQTSVFAEKLNFGPPKAIYSAAWYSGQMLDDTTFGMAIVPADGMSLEDAEAAMDQAVAEFLEEGVDPDALARIKMQVRSSEIYALDDISNVANRYGSGLTSGLTIADIEAWPSILEAVTEDDIIAAAREVFDRRNAVTGYIMPEKTTEVSQ
jgi:zinc protease